MSNFNDGMARLEEMAKRSVLEEKADKAIGKELAKLVLGNDPIHRFFAYLALKIAGPGRRIPDWSIRTACTDGSHLWYNPEWWCSLEPDEQVAVLSHECMHPAFKHHTRREWRDPFEWNLAADLSINAMVEVDCGLKLPKGRLMPGEGLFKDLPPRMSAEWYYPNLPKDLKGGRAAGKKRNPASPPGPQDNDGDDDDNTDTDPGGCGGVREPKDMSPADQRAAEEDWKVAVAQARQMAKQKGTLPAGIDRLVDELLAPQKDWKRELADYVTSHSKNDYSWTPPNRRLIHQGIYLPGMRSEEIGQVVCWFDTSGSISLPEMKVFGGELTGILAAYDCELVIVYCDAAIQHVQRWKPSDGPLVLEPKGGGGTSTVPFFKWIEEECEEEPSVAICLTDLYCDFPDQAPDIPVIWCVTGDNKAEPPFGRRIDVEIEP